MKQIKLNNWSFNQQGNMSNLIGLLNPVELGIVNVKVLRNLRHESLGLWLSASPLNPSVIANGGTANFYKVARVTIGGYSAASRNDPGDIPGNNLIKADIVGQRIARWEFETLDIQAMSEMSREGFISLVAEGVLVNVTALMDAEWLELAQETVNSLTNPAPYQKVIIPSVDDLNTNELRDNAYRMAARAFVSLRRQLSRYNLGSARGEWGAILHENVVNDLLLSVKQAGGGDKATDIGIQLYEGWKEVAGLGIVKDHLFLGQSIAADSAFAKDKAYDFSDLYGAFAHKEALFLAFSNLLTSGVVLPHSHNQEYVTKFQIYKQAIREELVGVILKPPTSDQATYNSEVQALSVFIGTAANAVIGAAGANLAPLLEAEIQKYTGANTVIDLANVKVILTNPGAAATVTGATDATAFINVPVLAGKGAIAPTQTPITFYYKNA